MRKWLVLAVAITVVSLPSTAQAHAWGQTVTNAQDNIYERYRGVNIVRCFGDKSGDSWVNDNSRWWTHLWCGGITRRGHRFVFKYHQRSYNGWTLTNLRGVSIYGLR